MENNDIWKYQVHPHRWLIFTHLVRDNKIRLSTTHTLYGMYHDITLLDHQNLDDLIKGLTELKNKIK